MPRLKGKRKGKTIALPNNPTKEQLLHFRKYLDRIYYDPAGGASYSTPHKLLKEVKRRNYYAKSRVEENTKILFESTKCLHTLQTSSHALSTYAICSRHSHEPSI